MERLTNNPSCSWTGDNVTNCPPLGKNLSIMALFNIQVATLSSYQFLYPEHLFWTSVTFHFAHD